jgi:hypothetical protein
MPSRRTKRHNRNTSSQSLFIAGHRGNADPLTRLQRRAHFSRAAYFARSSKLKLCKESVMNPFSEIVVLGTASEETMGGGSLMTDPDGNTSDTSHRSFLNP